jgi:predicted amidohydrolase
MNTRVAVCQIAVEDLSPRTNYERIQQEVGSLKDDVELAVFPEYALTGFVPDRRIKNVAVNRDSELIGKIRSLASEHDVAIVFGFIEATENTHYNATAYAEPEGDLTIYHKRHLWGREAEFLTAGSQHTTVETPLGRAGLLTCYDLNFVEDSATFTREEITALLVVGAWPAAYSENWRLLVRARALDGVRWVVGASRTGTRDLPSAPKREYAGRSVVARPDGGVHRALGRQERTLVTELDADVLTDQRELVGIFDD